MRDNLRPRLAWDEFWTEEEEERLEMFSFAWRQEHLLEAHAMFHCAWVKGDGTVVVKVEGRHPEERVGR